MSLLLRPTTLLGAGLGLSLALHPLSPLRTPSTPIQCQYSAPYSRHGDSSSDPSWTFNDQDPLFRKQGSTHPAASGTTTQSGGILTASNMRQVSLGSVLGLVAGVGLRAFSRVFVVLLGMGVVVVEWAAAKGYNVLPVKRMQKYVKSYDLQRVVSRHIPFKMTFGATMALAAFAQF
ncbi:uncharacterized protein BDW47DRAFT_83485 [Aspergillus candidus]|uniref:FUN14 family-domain-containing protein n=1 Tax=Aspergillus candidus TaxID=41067 RepID=A0A2I2F0D8_ASPCN|nr:hypothetical protein BDW47DRAFT_83485 [Aspergillus candidus]PLB34086.1 hypothetical protein BDW47DRAFT_83485 [Aspergillus candidus]